MKKQILNLGKALNKAEQKLINGGIPVQQGDAGGCWVKCNSGSLKQTTDCDAGADAMCNVSGWTVCSC